MLIKSKIKIRGRCKNRHSGSGNESKAQSCVSEISSCAFGFKMGLLLNKHGKMLRWKIFNQIKCNWNTKANCNIGDKSQANRMKCSAEILGTFDL